MPSLPPCASFQVTGAGILDWGVFLLLDPLLLLHQALPLIVDGDMPDLLLSGE